MEHPRKPGAGIAGALISLGSDGNTSTLSAFGNQDRSQTAITRLHASSALQRAAERLHGLGPRPVAVFIAKLIDDLGADPSVLDRLVDWQRLDPQILRSLGADRFQRTPLDVVPP